MAPFRVTPAEKPNAGEYDHWKGFPVYGNTHGKYWIELDEDEDEYEENTRQKILVAQGRSDDEITDFEETWIGETWKTPDTIVIDVEGVQSFILPTPDGIETFYDVYLHVAKRLLQVYQYKFLDWHWIRKISPLDDV